MKTDSFLVGASRTSRHQGSLRLLDLLFASPECQSNILDPPVVSHYASQWLDALASPLLRLPWYFMLAGAESSFSRDQISEMDEMIRQKKLEYQDLKEEFKTEIRRDHPQVTLLGRAGSILRCFFSPLHVFTLAHGPTTALVSRVRCCRTKASTVRRLARSCT